MRNRLTSAQKDVIKNGLQQNMKCSDIAKLVGVNAAAVRKFKQRYLELEGLPPRIVQSTCTVTARMGMIKKRYLLANSKLSIKKARALLIGDVDEGEVIPSESSFRRYLKRCGWKNVKSVWQPPTSERIRAQRLEFVDRWLVNGVNTLEDVIWSYETTVNPLTTAVLFSGRKNPHPFLYQNKNNDARIL